MRSGGWGRGDFLGWLLDMSFASDKIWRMRSKVRHISKGSGKSRRRAFMVGFMDGLGAHVNLFSFAFSSRSLTSSRVADIGSPAQAWAETFKFINCGFESIARDVDEIGKQQGAGDKRGV